MMEFIPRQCAEGDEGQVQECREGRPQDLEGAEGQVSGGRPPGNRGSQMGYRFLSSRRATLSGELSAAAPCARVEKGTGLDMQFERTIRMFKAARNRLFNQGMLARMPKAERDQVTTMDAGRPRSWGFSLATIQRNSKHPGSQPQLQL